jgi:hypothetical protein
MSSSKAVLVEEYTETVRIEYTVEHLLALDSAILIDMWVDAMCARFPGTMLDMVKFGIGNLSGWMNMKANGLCGCLVGAACIVALKSEGKTEDVIWEDSDAGYNAPEELFKFIQRNGNGNPLFSEAIIRDVGGIAPNVAFRMGGDRKYRMYLTERIVANLGLMGYITPRRATALLSRAIEKII